VVLVAELHRDSLIVKALDEENRFVVKFGKTAFRKIEYASSCVLCHYSA
jgi:hypothetical protein